MVRLQRQMQERPDLDPHLGWTSLDGRGMRVRRLSPSTAACRSSDLVAAVKSPRWGKKDLRALARDSGRLLARAHGRARHRRRASPAPGPSPARPATAAA